ncbi:MAG: ABC transporter ATP-binding protein [Fusobacterium sp.]|nr:ABC transporter ATP-binding protein [Fusobacterium sp.]
MLKIKNLNFSYGETEIIKNLNLEVNKGEVVAILGDSGSGKSTLLRVISGLENQNSGDIFIEDINVNDILPENRKVGMVFQDYALFPHMTVFENVAFCLKRNEDKSFAEDLMKTTDIYRHKDKYPHELSGGEKQRVALSRALCYKPKIMLLDEPFSNLDESLKSSLRIKIKDILNHYGITTILVTHDKEDARVIGEKYYYMKKGEIEELNKEDL